MPQSAFDTKPNTVLIKNIYYLMSYAFNMLDVREYCMLETEDFSEMEDLLSAILLMGIESQRRRGFERDYQSIDDQGWRIKGRIDIRHTMQLQLSGRSEASYVYDEYTENTLFNQILKTCALILSGNDKVNVSRRQRLHGALAYLQHVSPISNPERISWSRIRFHRNNRSYQLLMSICYLILQQQLMGESKGERHLAMFDDVQAFSSLFERFLLNYYKHHFLQLHPKGQKPISPVVDAPSFLPTMFEDVVLTHKNKTLILDAKCYGKILSMRFNQKRLSAEHVRQIYYYASHTGTPDNTTALLIYAGTEKDHITETWHDQNYRLGCVTLDLNQAFDKIRSQLDAIPNYLLFADSD